MAEMMGLLPGVPKIQDQLKNAQVDDKMVKRQLAILSSMTPAERKALLEEILPQAPRYLRMWVSSVASLAALALGQRVGDFALLDHRGKFHQMSWYGDKELLVLFIQGNGCPIARNAVPALKALRDEFGPSGVAFFMLNPQPQDNRESINEEAARFDYDFPILLDDSQLVAETLGVSVSSAYSRIRTATQKLYDMYEHED